MSLPRGPILLRVSLLACALALDASRAAAAGADPAAKAEGCFTRTYDADHLRAHPGQKTVAAKASFRQLGLKLELVDPAHMHLISAACSWAPEAGRDIKGKPLLPAFKGKAAYDCIVTTSEESAEEGGYLILAPAPDGNSLTLYLDSPVAARANPQSKARPIVLGPEDHVFKLMRAPPASCTGLER